MIIGLCGYKGSGKNQVSDYIAELTTLPVKQIAFADKIKEATSRLLGLSHEEIERFKRYEDGTELYVLGRERYSDKVYKPLDVSIRGFLQRMGTEVGRDMFGHNFWVEQALPVGVQHKYKIIIVSDVRFDNEAAWIKGKFNGKLWNIERPNIERTDFHISERNVNPLLYDETIINDGNLTDLKDKVKNLLKKHKLLTL